MCVYKYVFVCMCLYVCVCIYVFVCMSLYVSVWVCVHYIIIYIYIHIIKDDNIFISSCISYRAAVVCLSPAPV